MVFKKHNPGCPCCDDDCNIPIEGWNQVSGTWGISNENRDVTTEDSMALAVTANAHPLGYSSHYVTMLPGSRSDSDTIRIIVAYEDVNNYLYGEIEFGSIFSTGVNRLYSVVSGVHTKLAEIDGTFNTASISDNIFATICYHDDQLILITKNHSGTSERTIMATVSATGTRIGVGTSLIGISSRFLEVQWSIHKGSSGVGSYPECPEC